MAVAPQSFWDGVLELTKSAQEKNVDPLMWAMQMSSALASAGMSTPSPELANLLVSHICWANNVPIAWKFLEKASTLRLVPPMLIVALLSARVVPYRKRYPVAYRLYMELVKRYAFYLPCLIQGPNYKTIMESIDNILHLSQTFGLLPGEPGIVVAELIFSIVWELLDASLEDEGLLELTLEKKSMWLTRSQDMEIDNYDSVEGKITENQDVLQKMNTVLAVEIIGEFFQNKVCSRILFLARRNMPMHWESFMQHLKLLTVKSASLRISKHISPEALLELTSNMRRVFSREDKTSSVKSFHAVMATGSLAPSAGQRHNTSHSSLWLPIDLFLEDAMDGSQVTATSAAETLTGIVKALQALNRTSWQDTFLGLWIAGLRLVQREMDSSEGPVPRIDTCLCMLLSITPLTIQNIIEEEENPDESDGRFTTPRKEKQPISKRRQALVASLQQLRDYEGLLTPPPSASSLANQAAAKAMMFLSGLSVGNGYFDGISLNDMPIGCSGNLQHLIAEACIARDMLDTSAYLWPGYVKGRTNQLPRNISAQMPGWSSLMKGVPLTPPMVSALVSIPAPSLAEVEKIYEIATRGSDEDKISAATVLCGACLARGWNIQEHSVLFITKLLSPPIPADDSGMKSHLINCGPFINVLLIGISTIDAIQIFSLHGLIPHLAGALMTICEAFGSCAPNATWTLSSGEEISTHAIFSNAFSVLLKLWRFDQPPIEHVFGDKAPVGARLTPEHLLLLRNMQLASTKDAPREQSKCKRLSRLASPSGSEPLLMDSFPRLKQWYRQHQACIASTLSGLVPGTPVHQIVDCLLTMMFRRINRGVQPTPTTSSSSNSSGNIVDDFSSRLNIPAWDILEAVPYVLDASLTACGHGTLSPRELATGLKDLADFLPASLGAIVSYFSAEVTRGVWKPACMNGSDWPAAVTLANVEEQIKKILAATGVDVPSLAVGGTSVATLPLPLAAFVSLTITYKLDKTTDRFLNLVGPCLSNLATGCPWPCMPIIAALWSQKVKRWSDFLVFSASRTVFHHSSDAVVQLLRVCFSATLGLNSPSISTSGGVGALLGHGFGSHFYGGISAVAPGILYLRVHRAVRNVMFMTEEIVSLLMQSVKDIVSSGLPQEKMERLKKTKYSTKYGQVSLAASMSRVKIAASLGASLIWITGGPNSVQSLIKETLPSWFISGKASQATGGESEGMVAMLGGYALAYFAVLCGSFGWGVDSTSSVSKRGKVLGTHLEFLASAVEGKISLGCSHATWKAYVTGFVSLVVGCTPNWMKEMDVAILRRVSRALKLWNEEELALALLGISGIGAMGAAAEMIVEIGY